MFKEQKIIAGLNHQSSDANGSTRLYTPDNKREHCIHTDEGVCDTCKSDREIEDNNI